MTENRVTDTILQFTSGGDMCAPQTAIGLIPESVNTTGSDSVSESERLLDIDVITRSGYHSAYLMLEYGCWCPISRFTGDLMSILVDDLNIIPC